MLTPFVIASLFFVPFWYFLVGLVVFRVFLSINGGIYHEYLVHRLLTPRNKIVEFIGYYFIAITEMEGPYSKALYHWKHHRFYNDPQQDPTMAKLLLAKNFPQFALDLSPHAEHYYVDPSRVLISETPMYHFFNKHYKHIMILNLIVCLSLIPFWTFMAVWMAPAWCWCIVYRYLDWRSHRMGRKDENWMVLLFGSQSWHFRHHNTYIEETETYYGPGVWRWLNFDFYIQHLLFKPTKSNPAFS